MRKTLILASITVLCASVTWGQDPSTQQPTSQSQSSSTTPTASTGIQGCLSGSAGNYVLTQDNTGNIYRLSADDNKLKDHVGHEVQISGQLVSGAPSAQDQTQASATNGSTGDGAAANTLQVSDVTMISEHCNSSSGGSTPPSASNTTSASTDATGAAVTSDSATHADSTSTATAAPGSAASAPADANSTSATAMNSGSAAAQTPQSDQSSSTPAAQDSTPSSPAAGQPNDHSATSQSETASATTGDLPQTATDLPMIGLLGLGLLAAGIASKRGTFSGRD